MSIIRKLSVGKDYPNGSIHYQVGKQMNLMSRPYTISAILYEEVSGGCMAYCIYIEGEHSTVLWKQVVDMPVHVELDITFD